MELHYTQENIKVIKKDLADSCKLIAVSKYRETEDIKRVYDFGIRDFAENRVQPLLERHEELPKDIKWHIIGHLQRNKVKYIAPFIHMIHSVDSIRLLKEINKRALENERVIPCLLQFHIAQEESKFGFSPADIENISNEIKNLNLSHVQITGLMAMATFTKDESLVEQEFAQARDLSLKLQEVFPKAIELSIGMSGDYEIAQKFGSTMVRIGSKIFEK